MKTAISIAILFLIAITITSCTKGKTPATDNAHPADTTTHHTDTLASIIGKWEADSVNILATISGYPVGQEDTTFQHGHSIVQIFNADSSLILIDNTSSPSDTTTGQWYVTNGMLYGRYSGETNYTLEGSYTILNNQLIIQQTIDSLGAVVVEKLYSTRQ
jgi:hypothetical protein